MGEAKRRKKLLGKDYGQKPPLLVEGSPQVERHLRQLADAWAKKLAEIGKLDDLEEAEQKIKEEELNQWMRDYLAIYSQSEREIIVRGILDPVYAEIAQMPESEIKAVELAVNWSLEALSLYKMFKPYLPKSSVSEYAKPLINFYELVIAEAFFKAKGDAGNQAELQKLKQEFEEVLEIEESKRIG